MAAACRIAAFSTDMPLAGYFLGDALQASGAMVNTPRIRHSSPRFRLCVVYLAPPHSVSLKTTNRDHVVETSRAYRLEISFSTFLVRDLCEKREVAAAALGYDVARQLEDRLADFLATEVAADLKALFPQDLEERTEHEWSLRLSESHALVFSAAHVKPKRLTPEGATDWNSVTRIRVEAIEVANG